MSLLKKSVIASQSPRSYIRRRFKTDFSTEAAINTVESLFIYLSAFIRSLFLENLGERNCKFKKITNYI